MLLEEAVPLVCPRHLSAKQNLDKRPNFRICFDFRALKSLTKFCTDPVPLFEETDSPSMTPNILQSLTVTVDFGRLV